MKRFWSIIAAAVAAAVVAAGVGATSTKTIAFTGKYGGNAVTKQNDEQVAIAAHGAGVATLIGTGKITGNGTADASQKPCVPFIGTGAMTGAKGTVSFKVVPGSTGCGDESGQVFSIVGRATVTKATGALLKAKGTLKFTGTYDRSSGDFSVKFAGTLTK